MKHGAVPLHDSSHPVLLDTASDSKNTGDEIIMSFVNYHLGQFIDVDNAVRISTHELHPDSYTPDIGNRAKILCGTNALYSDFDLCPSMSLPSSPKWYS